MIDQGSIVTPNYKFDREQNAFPQYTYPKMGMLLTVAKTVKDELGNLMLWFNDFKIPIPLAAECFDELQDEWDGDEILSEAYKIANNLP